MTGFAVLGHVALPSQYHSATAPILLTGQEGASLQLHAGRGTGVHVFDLAGSQLRLEEHLTSNSSTVAAQIGSTSYALERAAVERLVASSDRGNLGLSRSEAFFSGQSGFAGDLASLISTPVGGREILIGAAPGGNGLQSFERQSDGSLTRLQWRGDNSSSYARDVSAMASLELGGSRYVFTASQGESGISGYALTAGGQLNLRSSLGAAEGVGMSQNSTLLALEVGGRALLLAGAAGSGTLSVMGVSSSGGLSLLDQVSDSRDSRFGGISLLESISHNGWTYVVAGGSDDGLTLFALLPSGRLILLDTLEHSAGLGLENVNGLALHLEGNTLHVFATSEIRPGITHLSIGTTAGEVLEGSTSDLSGSSEDDLILAGAAQRRLWGGAGEDIFVFAAGASRSGASCRVMDFNPEEDRIDLQAWAGLRSVDQLQITSHSNGATLRYGAYELRLITSDTRALTYEDFILNDLLGLYRPPLPTDTPLVLNGTAAAEQLVGAGGNDTVLGLGAADRLYGQGGHDSLAGGDGADRIYGGTGNDHLSGEADSDRIEGEDGHDSLFGGSAHDSLYGGMGNDSLAGETGADHLYGGWGNDTLSGDSSTDRLYGEGGNDSLTGGTGNDTLYGGAGHDRLFGNSSLDTLYGEGGHDYISAGDGVDFVSGGSGNDTIHGRSGWDNLEGGDGNDSLYGSEGDDLIRGGRDNDWVSAGSAWDQIFGNSGDDTLYGNFGSDQISGGSGRDSLFGGTGDDTLRGGSSSDALYGNQGVDHLEGGSGNDTLRGGTLADSFIFAPNHDSDLIEDFTPWQDELHFASALVDGATNTRAVVEEFARVTSLGVQFDFGGGDRLLLQRLESLSDLHNAIEIF
ncbi:hypothetical protein RSK20926_01017 [Roseobacter sp. SK209-2-6]|uniref:calcium-binding protein n=1 Tax=Roseobacter sp. SK209-2-6 TaxID=388739 RepID=UPI0000F3F4AF|nr:hypothetical protein [Roseobacter sp. SK209-2-6]EBA14532.1 hypothetical protein RSK20926_01017 [Roseobacter sp. SK209-2-6]